MAVVIHRNLRRSTLAQDLLTRITYEHVADLTIISEQYHNLVGRGWYSDNTNIAAIWVNYPCKVPVTETGKGDGFVWVRSNNTTFVSVYWSPNEGIAVFHQKLESLKDAIREMNGEVIVAGDLNANTIE